MSKINIETLINNALQNNEKISIEYRDWYKDCGEITYQFPLFIDYELVCEILIDEFMSDNSCTSTDKETEIEYCFYQVEELINSYGKSDAKKQLKEIIEKEIKE